MHELKKACQAYVEKEKFLNNQNIAKQNFENHYKEFLEDYGNGNSYSVEEAEKVFSVFSKIEEHRQRVLEAEKILSQSEEVIKKYLEPLQGKTITYVADTLGETVYRRFNFHIIDGKVRHNYQTS